MSPLAPALARFAATFRAPGRERVAAVARLARWLVLAALLLGGPLPRAAAQCAM
ncbi:MAG: hypothetical protein JNL90_16900 [Planctomycetes bacterium]|nr:hypothetical protein [Planctomycetota bacterium]